MEDRVYLGIDVGAKGFIALNTGKNIKYYSIADNDMYSLSNIFRDIKTTYPNVVCVMEEIHALYNSAAKATFSFGEINGILKGLLIANNIPYHLIPPKKWQAEIWGNKDIVVTYKTIIVKGKSIQKKEINTKQTSYNAARRLFPMEDLRRTEKCKKFDDNKVDSLLISEYGRRMNL